MTERPSETPRTPGSPNGNGNGRDWEISALTKIGGKFPRSLGNVPPEWKNPLFWSLAGLGLITLLWRILDRVFQMLEVVP